MFTFNFNLQFFDRKAVLDRVGAGKARVLSKAGAFIRQRAKTLIRPAPKSGKDRSAKPGDPPKSHVGLLRDRIFFALDQDTDSVVIGPELLNSARKNRGTEKTVPLLLETGGSATTAQGKPANYHKFPYMQPAFDAEKDNFADLFANSVR
jgi:hypothetical protein